MAGCADLGPGIALDFNFDGPVCNASCYDATFAVFPNQQNFLRGDSIEIITFSTKGFSDATWSSSGAVSLIRRDGSLDSAITVGERSVWARAVRAGTGVVHAQAVGAAYSDSARFLIADPSDITDMLVYGTLNNTLIKVGTTHTIDVVLIDASGQSFKGKPTGWSVSDSTLFDLVSAGSIDRTSQFTLVPKKTGNASMTFMFLGVRKTVSFTIS